VQRQDGGGSPAELEFILRTLFDLKLDVDDLRREFESYRQRRRQEPELPLYPLFPSLPPGGAILSHGPPEPERAPEVVQEEAVVYRAGMTMQDLEREAIALALKEVKGNRRKAAENLGIGERTLYRKIKDYGIEV
jgi:DNA-binding NtrC family response regulator